MGRVDDLKVFVGCAELTKTPGMWRMLLAEYLGTAFLVLVGCFSCIGWGDGSGPSITQIALCFGITVATIAQVRRIPPGNLFLLFLRRISSHARVMQVRV